MAGGPEIAPRTLELWSYEDASGTTVIAESLEKVPLTYRARAKKIELTERGSEAKTHSKQTHAASPAYWFADIHAPSFLFGLTVAFVLTAGSRLAVGGLKVAFKLALVAGLLALL